MKSYSPCIVEICHGAMATELSNSISKAGIEDNIDIFLRHFARRFLWLGQQGALLAERRRRHV